MSKSQSYPVDALFRGLRGLLGSLPTDAEKRELLQTLQEAQEFLEDLRLLVDAIPTMESSQDLSMGLSRLDSLMAQAQRDAPLRKLMGLRGHANDKKTRPVSSEDISEKVGLLADTVSQTESHAVAALLERESAAVLKALADHFGIRTRSRERKMDLAGRISTYVENQRGYALLRGADTSI